MIDALVASVPMPDTFFNIAFTSGALTNLSIFFIASRSVAGVNLFGGLVIPSVIFELINITLSSL